MITSNWEQLFDDDLAERRHNHLDRARRVVAATDATHLLWEGKRYVNFASNNYLGLTHHPRLIERGRAALAGWGAGSGASALISGYGPAHAAAEVAIARWKGTEAAVLLPSGYQANHAAVQTLAALGKRGKRGVRILLDKLAHASLVDAVRATGAPFRVFPHNHLGKLRRLLSESDAGQRQVVLTESIFSMDGDAAPLADLSRLKQEFGFLLFLDEAHASGVYGPIGEGLAAESGVGASVDVSVVTLSKALGCIGGAVCASSGFCEAVVNHGRAFIYSTSLPPHIAEIAEEAVNLVKTVVGRRERVRALARRVRAALTGVGSSLSGGDSPIIALITGTEESALGAAESLRARGMLVAAVRPPSVPRGKSRLRITLSSEHTDGEVDELIAGVQADIAVQGHQKMTMT